MSYLVLLGGLVGCVLLILVSVFLKWRWLRPLAVAAGAVALWLPLLSQLQTLGAPNPYPPDGDYRIISSKLSDAHDMLYIFAEAMGADTTPRMYQIPFDLDRYERLTDTGADYTQQILRIEGGNGDDYDIVYVDYTPPDLLKGDMMRAYRAPRPDD